MRRGRTGGSPCLLKIIVPYSRLCILYWRAPEHPLGNNTPTEQHQCIQWATLIAVLVTIAAHPTDAVAADAVVDNSNRVLWTIAIGCFGQ